MPRKYEIEREGQIDFFKNYKIPYDEDNSILTDDTDGIYNGVLLEFKLNINNLNSTLFQAIKYLSRIRIKGENLPAKILLIDLNSQNAYEYNSKDYLCEIEKEYVGAASKNNTGFIGNDPTRIYNYDEMEESNNLKKLLKNKKTLEEKYIPININETCIVGWAERYYRENPKAKKGDFIGDDEGVVKITGEIREPVHFKGLINPYKEKTNVKFKYLMDCLNDRLQKKDLGAFYTPEPYAKKAAELVKLAVDRAIDGGKKDYIVLDRCVDEETEYFNGKEWKKIKDYTEGEKVLTWYPNGSAKIELPKRYINQEADEPFYHYVSNTLDMCLSGSHNIVYEVAHKVKGSPLRVAPCYEVFEKWNLDSNGFRGRIPLTFELPEKETETINEEMLRVAVMINADGTYREKRATIHEDNKERNKHPHDIFEVRVYKERKKQRCRELLNKANIEFREKDIPNRERDLQGTSFVFRFPFNAKKFPKEWIYLPISLKRAFIDELLYWDGSVRTSDTLGRPITNYRYFSSKKDDVDIVQIIAHSCGFSTRIREDKRSKNINYTLSFRSNIFSKMTKENKNHRVMHTGTFKQESKERKYCFETNSGFLILRRNNKIFVTGNCSGTGNLESALVGLYDKNGDEIISHTVISTFEYYEYKVLNERLGDKVRDIIPPTEADVIYSNGTVANADAMSCEYINNPIIKKYLEDEDCAIIMLENPPYRDITASDKVKVKEKSFVYKKFVEEGTNQSAHRELSNLFIWSAFKYYLREDTDSYIVFSPIKYFKYNKIPNTKFKKGFIFNRKHFHASPASISCIYWSNMQGKSNVITLEIYDINENKAHYIKKVDAKRMYNTFNKFNDKRAFEDDVESDVYVENGSGQESEKVTNKTAIYNGNIIAYLRATSINLNAMSRCLTRTITYDALTQSYGFYIRKDNYLKKLPLFVAKLFPLDNWYEKDFLFTSSDGGDAYTKDETFLKSCLIYTCLSNQNKCLSFTGSDGRYYKNELCFEEGTLASKDLKSYNLDESEKELLDIWEQILEKAKKTKNYNKDLSYGVYQIIKELNTFQKVKIGKTIKNSYDYPELNGNLETLRVKLKEYYKSHIWNKMFQYELVK